MLEVIGGVVFTKVLDMLIKNADNQPEIKEWLVNQSTTINGNVTNNNQTYNNNTFNLNNAINNPNYPQCVEQPDGSVDLIVTGNITGGNPVK